MTTLRRIRVDGLRNLRAVDMTLGEGITVLEGPNGAGKTALVEAIYLLSRGRSFRGRRHGPLVGRDCERALVEGWVECRGVVEPVRWQGRGGSDNGGAPADGPGTGRSARLSVRLICEATHSLVEGEPSIRRRFIDWNLFHVEHRFSELRSRFRRIAAQRAAWLKSGARGHAIWDRPYAEALCDVARARERFCSALGGRFGVLTREVDWFSELTLHWRSGIGSLGEAMERLEQMRESDQARGFTALGLSRDDFGFWERGRRWVGSRGETKIVGILVQMAAQGVVDQAGGGDAVWLVDDLGAELADVSRDRVFEILRRHTAQVLLTALPGRAPATNAPVFHVEHGSIALAERPRRPVVLSAV